MSNEEMAEHWAAGAAGWIQHEARFDRLYAPATDAILAAAEIAGGQKVLDVGCGTGTLLQAVVAAGSDAVGIDISPAMVAAAAARVPRARVVVGDAQNLDLSEVVGGRAFDRVVSRFGVMFFEDPVAAFDRIGRATSNSRLAFVCWRSLAENPTFTLGTQVLVDRLPDPGPTRSDAPGPMAFEDPDRLRRVLTEAQWQEVTIEQLDFDCHYGQGENGIEERVAIVFATSVGQKARALLEPELGPVGWSDLLDEVRDQVRSHLHDDVVRIPAATWLVTARR